MKCVRKKCDKNNKNCRCVEHARTDNVDYTGFPVIQSYLFNGKKFCGRRFDLEDNSGDNFVNYMNVEVEATCSEGKRNCGSE